MKLKNGVVIAAAAATVALALGGCAATHGPAATCGAVKPAVRHVCKGKAACKGHKHSAAKINSKNENV